MGWAHAEGILDRHPLDGMRGPPQPSPRMHVPVEQVVALLAHAQRVLEDHVGFGDRSHRSVKARHRGRAGPAVDATCRGQRRTTLDGGR
jgi:hypothetical protein